jgi:hypothetical protein
MERVRRQSLLSEIEADLTAVDPESDDEFDETTLWEIANLLNTRDVPSKDSLLPPGRAEIIEDYDETDNESEETNQSKKGAPTMSLRIQPLSVARETSQLWASDVASASSTVGARSPEPELSACRSLVPSSNDAVRSNPRTPNNLPMQMWSSPAERTEDRKPGLFTTPAAGSVIRTTQAVPAAVKMAKTPRQATNFVPKISSQNLWTAAQNVDKTTEWIFKSTTPRIRHASVSSPFLWNPPAKVGTVTVLGLFNPSARGCTFRTSSLAPAALNMICKPRRSQALLSELKSTSLWNRCSKLSIEQDWISVSSVRPESPSGYSTTSSGSSSPASDSSSVKSTSTKASSLWNSTASASIGWEEKKSAPTSPEREPKHLSKAPVHQQSFKQLAPLRESRVLASRDLWESKAPVLDVPARKFQRSVAGYRVAAMAKPIRHQHRANFAFRADWEEALSQAIVAGTPKQRLTRPLASTSDWESALAEAVALGHVMKAEKFDPSVMHPVFFTDSLFSSSADVHPAAIGYVAKQPAYDASILHPVFFTDCLISNANEVHPAALGHLANQKPHAGMWKRSSSSPTPTPTPEATQLWSKNTGQARDVSMHCVELGGHVVRRALPIKPLNLPALSSSMFWQQPAQAAKQQRHWLKASHAKPISAPDPVQGSKTNVMFAKDYAEISSTHWLHETSAIDTPLKKSARTEKNNPASASLFSNPHPAPWSRKKREDAPLNQIESTQMWRPYYGLPESPKNWLVNKRPSRVEFRY